MITRINRFITEFVTVPPEHGFYYYAFWIYFFKDMSTKFFLYMTFLGLGAAQPEMDPAAMEATMRTASEKMVVAVMGAYQRLFVLGQEAARNDSLVGWILSNIGGYLAIASMLGIVTYLCFGIFRHVCHHIYKRFIEGKL